MSDTSPRTLLFVHAHPDDETLATGVTLAQRVLDGDRVHVLTCTLGDEGEVIPDDLRHHEAAQDDTLGGHRRVELRAAMAALGVQEHVLGEAHLGPSKTFFRDSGMAGTPSMEHPRALCGQPLESVAELIGIHLRDLRPDVVVTYDPYGGYEHPDHIRVHDATCAAVAAISAEERPDLWAVVTPESRARADRAGIRAGGPKDAGLTYLADDELYPAGVVPDDLVAWTVTGSPEALARRDAALREHVTQVRVGDGWYALSNDIAAPLATQESYAPLDAVTGALARWPASRPVDPRRAP